MGARAWVARLPRSGLGIAFVGLVIFAVVARILYLVDYAGTIPTYVRPLADAKIYDEWSARIASGDVLGSREGVFYRAPLYPYLLAALRSVVGGLQPATAILQSALGLGTALLTARLAGKWAGPGAALACFGILSFYGPLYTAEPKLLGTVLGLFLQVAAFSLALSLMERPRVGAAVGLGLLVGGAALVRPFWLLWVLALPLALVGARSAWTIPRVWVAFLSGVLLAILPVTVRNQVIGEDFVLIASNGGMTFFQGNNVENRSGLLTIISRFEMFGSAERQEEIEARVASELSGRALRPSETGRFWLAQGLDFITGSPGRWLELEGRKLFRFVSSFEPGDNYSHALERERLGVLKLLFLPFGVILALALLGLRSPSLGASPARLAILGAVTGLFGCLIFFVSSRYRLEAVPGLAILAGAGLADLFGRVRHSFGQGRLRHSFGQGRGRSGPAPQSFGRGRTRPFWRTQRPGDALIGLLVVAVLAVTWLPAGAPARSQESISLLQVGNAYERLGQREAAYRAYLESIEALPANAFAWRSLLQLTVQDSGAAVALGRADAVPPDVRAHPEIRHLRGRFLAALGRHGESIEELTAVAREQPDMREAWFYLGTALREEGRYREAESALVRARETGWPEEEVLPVLSFLRIQTGDLRGAREAASAALLHDPEQRESRLNLLVANVYLGYLDEAEALLAERTAADPLTPYYRGLLSLRRGAPEAAEVALRQAIEAQPSNRRASYYHTLVLVALGRGPGSWPSDEEADPVVARWIEVRSSDPWSGVPVEGPAKTLWEEIRANPGGARAEIVRYVGEEEAGLHPAGNP